MSTCFWGLQARPNFDKDLLSRYQKGKQLADTNNLIEAAKIWQELASSTSKSPTLPNWLTPWLLLHAANQLADAKSWEEADRLYKQVGQLPELTPGIKANALRALANGQAVRMNWIQAEKYYQESAEAYQKSGTNDLALADVLSKIGLSERNRGQFDGAEEHLRHALDIHEKLVPNSASVATDFGNLGTVALVRGELTKAQELLRRALAIHEKLVPDSASVAADFGNLGAIALARGELTNAEEYLQRALAIQEKLEPNSIQVSNAFANLGQVAFERGELAEAEEYYMRSLTIRERIAHDSTAVAGVIAELGSVALQRGELAKAEENYIRALGIYEKLAPGSAAVVVILNNLGIAAKEREELAKAEEYYFRALAIQEKLAPGGIAVASILANIGNIAQDRREFEKAKEYQVRALAIEEKHAPDSLAVATILNNIGNAMRIHKDFPEAEKYYGRALTIQEKLAPDSFGVALSLNNLSSIAQDRGDISRAESYLKRALAIREKLAPNSLDVAYTLNNLGIVAYDEGNDAEARDYFERALVIRERSAPGSADLAETLFRLAKLMVHQGQQEAALQFYARGLDTLESHTARMGGAQETRSEFRAQNLHFYKEYVGLLLAQKQPERAFYVLERSRARSLLETLAAAHVDVRRGVDPSLFQQEHSLRELVRDKSRRRIDMFNSKATEKQLAQIEREISGLLTQYDDVEGRIRSTSPAYAALTQPQALNAQQVQELLDADTVLLEYSLGEEQSHIFLVTPDSLTVYDLPKRVSIEAAARDVHKLLTFWDKTGVNASAATGAKHNERDLHKAANTLSELVLGPVAEQIKGKRLVIVSDGVLEYIPFAALPIPRAFDHNIPLIVEHEIVALPSASALAELRRQAKDRKEAPNAVAVLADPVFDKNDERVHSANSAKRSHSSLRTVDDSTPIASSWPNAFFDRSSSDMSFRANKGSYLPRLFFTRREAKKILEMAPPGKSLAALDFKASRATILDPELAHYRIVHIATHGLVNSVNPGLSGLVLSLVDEKGDAQDGFLDLQDIYNLNLNAHLAVLSACQTGLGKEVEGEGLEGMVRGFMYAGASRVVASLWNVEDSATAELMESFYKAMNRDQVPPAAALRQAQIQMWKQKRWRHPYYWAGFQIQGEWK